MSSLLEDKDAFVKKSLLEFLQAHCGESSLGAIDDIVLSYVVGILEELCENSSEEFDVEQFTEMMSAYFPKFAELNSGLICEWMFNLASCIRSTNTNNKDFHQINFHIPKPTPQEQEEVLEQHRSPGKRTKSNSSTSDGREDDYEEEVDEADVGDEGGEVDEEMEKQIEILNEMFPTACTLELHHCLCIAEGDTETAAQLVLHRQETGESIRSNSSHRISKGQARAEVKDCDIRQHVLSRYMYVEESEDKKEHRPMAPKWEPKKLIRYRNNQVVSIKGEKYTEVKETQEGDEMKKTYVTLKPSRQYRFH